MAYHHGNRRLVFLKSPLLVDVVRRLDDFESADAALDSLVGDENREALRRALETLTSSEIVRVG
jgi:putative mycofactocin binding protein MftB